MRWSIEKANEWSKKTGWLVGFNYVPATAVNPTEMWQDATFDRETIKCELALAAQAGFNSCRVFLQFIVWENERDIFMKNFADFCDIAVSNGISVMPVFFDDCWTNEPYLGKQNDPVPGKHNSGWTTSPGFITADDPAKETLLHEYVTSIVGTYRDNPAIVVWDLYNEPGASGRAEKCVQLVEKAFTWARSMNPVQPLTVGYWEYKEYNKRFIELSDIVSFHDYMKLEDSIKQIERFKQYDRPLLCTEWLNRAAGNTFNSHLPMYHGQNVGVYNWGLFAGKTQTYLSYNASENVTVGYPEIWKHDIFFPNGKPFCEDEIKLILELRNK